MKFYEDEVYKRMCIKAQQDIRQLTDEDFVKKSIIVNGKYIFTEDNVIVEICKSFYWLPRQDQLQEMIGGNLVSIFCDYIEWETNGEDHDTMEMIWLKIVMQSKFNKTWNGEDWI